MQILKDPVDWTVIQATGLIVQNQAKNSRLQFKKNPVDWIVIQATGLINPNQTESPGGISMKIQSTG
jgi:hypothetical protein